MSEYIAYTDGAARGVNGKGPASCAFVIYKDGAELVSYKECLGPRTNNYAEYTAFIRLLEACLDAHIWNIKVYSDSELMVKQFSGEYGVKHEYMKILYAQVKELCAKMESVTLAHVRREFNKRADELCNQALDEEKSLNVN